MISRKVLVLTCVALCLGCATAVAGPEEGRGAGLSDSAWSPYLVGALIGLLCCVTMLTVGRPLGVSTSFVTAIGMIEKRCCPKRVEENEYFKKHPPAVDWQFMFVSGILIGAIISAVLFGDFKVEFVPRFWVWQFGFSRLSRWFTAFIGGLLLMIGARWAGGCTSGHGISGCLQLAVSGWIAAACFFASGIIVANLLYGF